LIDCGHLASAEGDFQRITRPLALKRNEVFLLVREEAAEHGIGLLSVHHDLGFTRQGVTIGGCGGPGVAKQSAENVSEEVRQQVGFLEFVGLPGVDEICPMMQAGPGVFDGRWQNEVAQLLADDFRVEERFGFDCHECGRSLANWQTDGSKELRHILSSGTHNCNQPPLTALPAWQKMIFPGPIRAHGSKNPRRNPIFGGIELALPFVFIEVV
jgi:hypothetical protein